MKLQVLFEEALTKKQSVSELAAKVRSLFPKADVRVHSSPDGISVNETPDFEITAASAKDIKAKLESSLPATHALKFRYSRDDNRVLMFVGKPIKSPDLKHIT